jgi:hypothetical protein
METILHPALLEALVGSDVADRVYQASSLGVQDVPPDPMKPFIVWRELPSTLYQEVAETSNSTRHTYSIYIYDFRGSYSRINELGGFIRDHIKTLEGTRTPEGVLCTRAAWLGMSQTFGDEQYEANVRYATVVLDGNQ